MIGNRHAWGQGFTILEEGVINRDTLEMEVRNWIACYPNGRELGSFSTLEAAKQAIEQLESQEK